MYMQGNHIKKATALISPDDAVLYAVFYLSGRRGSRKRLQISSISPTSRGTMLRSLLFIWIGEFSIFYHSTIKKRKGNIHVVPECDPCASLLRPFSNHPSQSVPERMTGHTDRDFYPIINRRCAIMDLNCENLKGIKYTRD